MSVDFTDFFGDVEIVVDLVEYSPSSTGFVFAVIGRREFPYIVDNCRRVDRVLREADVDVERMVEAEGWDDYTVLDEVRYVLEFTENVVSPLEYGRIQVKDSRWVFMKLPEPYMLRDPKLRAKTVEQLEGWDSIVEGRDDLMWMLDGFCVVCDGRMQHFDPGGLAWCDTHWQQRRL